MLEPVPPSPPVPRDESTASTILQTSDAVDMYEQVSHALLNDILDELSSEICREDLRHFYTRLGANFYAIHSLFFHLYGHREDFKAQITI
jgi:hypothetical protein